MEDDDSIEWPREIWAAERDEHDPTGLHVFSAHATVPRFEGDKERDREFHRYVDSDILDSTERYYKEKLDQARAGLVAALASDDRRWRIGEDRGDTFSDGDDFNGITLTLEIRSKEEAREWAAALAAGGLGE